MSSKKLIKTTSSYRARDMCYKVINFSRCEKLSLYLILLAVLQEILPTIKAQNCSQYCLSDRVMNVPQSGAVVYPILHSFAP